jgi:hypothetical protein
MVLFLTVSSDFLSKLITITEVLITISELFIEKFMPRGLGLDNLITLTE